MANEIPDIVIGRLPLYLRALTYMAKEQGKITTSSHELGQRLGISSAQIRKDLSHFGEFGKQGTGYHVKYLTRQRRQILHLQEEWPIVLVGSGYLGHALGHYQGFKHRGFQIKWIFDNDPDKIGQEMNGLIVQGIGELREIIRKEKIQIAIIAVPAAAAQEIADQLMEAGIKAILSYAPINLQAPKSVKVYYSDPVILLQRMTFYLDT